MIEYSIDELLKISEQHRKELEAKDKRLEHAEATIKRIYSTYQHNIAVSPVTMAQDYLDSYDLIEE